MQDGPAHLSDSDLLEETRRLAASERALTVQMIRLLCEVEDRRLHLATGCSTLFTYCTQILRLSEHAAFTRSAVTRAARQYPIVLELLERGEVSMTNLALIARHLTPENHLELLDAIRGRSKREVEAIVASRFSWRGLPTIIRAVGPDLYELRVAVAAQTLVKLHRAQDLLRHAIPNGDEGQIIDRALTVLIRDIERTKFAASDSPRPPGFSAVDTRHIPAAVRRAVRERDGDRCAFVGTGRRCTETAWLEFHHRVPFAEGGTATVDNIELRCRAHNVYEAECWFGPMMVRERETALGPLNFPRGKWRVEADEVAREILNFPRGKSARSSGCGISIPTSGQHARSSRAGE